MQRRWFSHAECCFSRNRLDGVSSSPSYLVAAKGALLIQRPVLTQDRVEDAYRAFVLTHADNNSDDSTVRSQFDQLHAQLLHEKRNGVSLVELFKRPTLRKRCIIGWLTMFGAQGTATLVINSTGS